MALNPKIINIEIDFLSTQKTSVEIGKCDFVKFVFTYKMGGEAYATTYATKMICEAFGRIGYDKLSTDSWFGGEFTSPITEAQFTSAQTAGNVGSALMNVRLLDADNNIINSQDIELYVRETGCQEIFTPSPQYRDEVLLAKVQAQDAATTATTKAAEAADSAAEALTHRDIASAAAYAASGFKTESETAADTATAQARNANTKATEAATSAQAALSEKNDCTTILGYCNIKAQEAEESASLAQTVSAIAKVVLSATQSAHTLQKNKLYTLDTSATGASENFSFTLPTTQAETQLNQFSMQLKIGSTAPSIVWGTTNFFKRIPIIETNSSYEIFYEYDFNNSVWVCGSIKKI